MKLKLKMTFSGYDIRNISEIEFFINEYLTLDYDTTIIRFSQWGEKAKNWCIVVLPFLSFHS